ncbi:ATP-binding protein [Pectobacterium carotovorum]|uniref:AAA family ATPase n=1 Tax=Pectobacterium carotovorum TaxID=554 RepID=UPI001F0FDA2F|nr:AAA family ATPase [Pectobacterium carotovorum]MCH4996039.1 ATP-binding protein [Pectobacterium carotovorum]
MMIKSFEAKNVHEFYNFNFTFNNKISFLVGLNGSGKTTAIKLIQAIIFFDFEYISKLVFDYAQVSVTSNSGNTYNISAAKSDSEIIFSINGHAEKVKFNEKAFQSKNHSILNSRVTEDDLTNYFERERFNLINTNPVFSKFNNVEKPIFLGLERTLGKYYEDNIYSYRIRKNNIKSENIALDISLRLFDTHFEKYKRSKELSNKKMLDIAFDSFFSYNAIDFDSYFSPENVRSMFEILNRAEELYQIVDKIDPSGSYKNKLQSLLSALNDDKKSYQKGEKLTLDLCFNLIQTNGLNELLKEFDKNKKISESRYKPIKDFCDSINEFLNSSGKHLNIDGLGNIKIFRGKKEINLDTLSSGEKQLLMLLSHSNFGVKNGGSFIIDEPELSLHLSWQESLIKNIVKGNDNVQYIFATHSPEIVGDLYDNCFYLKSE